jgi:hypothetical protein
MPTAPLLAATVCLLASVAGAQTTTAPADAETYERTLREERTRHADQVRKLTEEQDRLRAALDAARSRANEAEARRASLSKLVEQAEGATRELVARVVAARSAMQAAHESLARALGRVGSVAAIRGEPPADAGRADVAMARRIRLLLQFFDREMTAARTVSIVPRARGSSLGHELRLGALATFFVPTAPGAVTLEPSGREVPAAAGDALREVVRQVSKRGGRGSLVMIPWWGGP